MKTFEIETLGCKVNEYESAYYIEQMEQAGFSRAKQGEPADVLIINTCTVTNTAAAKSRRKAARLRRENPGALCVLVGCWAQTLEKEQRQASGADLVIGAAHKNRLAAEVLRLLDSEERTQTDLVEHIADLNEFESMPIGVFEDQHRAFLKIQDGCNQYCAYCQIPLARGPERSQIPAQVIESARALAQAGHQEIVLTGIHTGRYRFRGETLASLLKALLEQTPKTVCYRISSIEVTEVSDELLDLMKSQPRILPHLHIPIQAGCDATLARMKRPYTVAQFKERLEVIRQAVPEISISTDVMTGFVQESDEEFETTVQTLKDCRFSFLHVFPYSRRKGTAADSMSGFVDPAIAKERAGRLLELSRELRRQDMARFDHVRVLVERPDRQHPDLWTGYSEQYHPVALISDRTPVGRINARIVKIEDERMLAAAEADENETVENV